MSSAVSVERRKIIRSYGAKVILTPAEEGTDGAIPPGPQQGGRRPRQIFHARPVCQCGQLPGALPVYGTGNMAADRRQDRLPGLCDRYVGDADGAFAVPEGDEARHQGRLRATHTGPLYPGIEEYGGGYRPGHLRSLCRSTCRRWSRAKRRSPWRGDHRQGGDLRRHEQRRRDAGRPYAPRSASNGAISWWFSPTVPRNT